MRQEEEEEEQEEEEEEEEDDKAQSLQLQCHKIIHLFTEL